ncbi:putative extracellular nuclease [Treponema primitia ZAS-2]|uniref:Putative extracellular nuclease n=1 Tax=Treponema primitia (strain ATCC BAA-887 / DSM 12427 / ZAS-2) TaxID=545694 RepID=F5YQ85_TREPZ|nr:hypothetical protein [Treponema primitia]AEF86206.1 putative extracellular nuclease [Treponema primitia ZAS-2]
MNIYRKNGTKIAIVLAALLATGLILGSCANALGPENTPIPESATQFPAPGMGRLQISLELPPDTAALPAASLRARTIFPENQFTKYVLTFAETNGDYPDVEATLTSATASVDLPPGTWKITVKAYAGDILSGTGAAPGVPVKAASPASVRIRLDRYRGMDSEPGKLSWNITFPDGSYGGNTLRVLDGDGEEVAITGDDLTNPIQLGDESPALNEAGADIASGEYLVELRIKSDAGTAATWLGGVHVYPGQTTTITRDFTDGDFNVEVPVYGTVTTGAVDVVSRTVEAFSDEACSTLVGTSTVVDGAYTLFIPTNHAQVYLRLKAVISGGAIIYSSIGSAITTGTATAPIEQNLDGETYTIYAIITTNPGTGSGAITAPTAAFKGSTVAVTVTPEANSLLQAGSSLKVTWTTSPTSNVSISAANTFTMPAAAVTISATFVSKTDPDMAASMNGLAYTTLSAAITAAQGTASAPAVITLLNDVSSAPISFSNKYVQLVSSGTGGNTIKQNSSSNSNASLFTVGSNAILTLGDGIKYLALEEGYNNAAMITINATGTLVMNLNTMLQNHVNGNQTNNKGGGVYVNGGTFIMNGGTIIGNTALGGYASGWGHGGGVYMDGGTFTMNGGAISDNKAAYGGGVYMDGGIFIMNGGSISDNNGTYSGSGGGVYMYNGTFTMNGGAISGNTSFTSYGGGGVFMYNGTFNMNRGSISGNNAPDSVGGGVLMNTGTFNMNGGSISGNTADNVGGGVYVGSGTFNMNGMAAIRSNDVTGTTTNATINDAGGGVYIARGKFYMLGGTIAGTNTAASGKTLYKEKDGVAKYDNDSGAWIVGDEETMGFKDEEIKKDP